MKRSFLFFVLVLLAVKAGFSQKVDWRVDLYNFFDNTEFGRSAVKIPQTMAGVHLAPELGIVWDSVNKINAGANLLHEYGSPNVIDKVFPTAYYESCRNNIRFLMGAFPRSRTIDSYPRLFFQDSITYYHPNVNGIFTEYRQGYNYINVWLDWTGRQSKTVNETFFIGFSGRYKPGIFYLQHYGYMYHYAGKMVPVVEEPLHDNLLFLTSAGLDFSGKTIFTKLEANAGWVMRRERSRAENSGWKNLSGFMAEERIEYKWIGLFNTFYKGDDMMYFYKELANKLYWGDPTYRAKTSDRADFYLNFIQNRTVDLRLTYSLTFMENRMYHEQMLKLLINLNSMKN